MKTPLYWIPGPWPGRLATAPRPRGGDWLADEIAAWKADGITIVVSALTKGEAAHLDLDGEGEACKTAGVGFHSFPIPDVTAPDSVRQVRDFLVPIESRLASGDAVVAHCRMGIGRSSTLAACLLILAGVSPDDAFDRICTARGCTVPDTPEQRRWVERFAREHSNST
jgi:protein-tyrosine phosphatase